MKHREGMGTSAELREVNEQLRELEEVVRRCDAAQDFGGAFVASARAIIHTNDRRPWLQRAINRLPGAGYQEEKRYPLLDPAAAKQGSGANVSQSATSDPFRFFDVIYCINLDTRPERWEQAMGEFARIGIADRVERVVAVTHADPREGCRLSHLECARRAAAAGAQAALIFEDDVVFPSFSPERLARSLERLRTIPDWDLFYLGGLVMSHPSERTAELFRARLAQSHAYAIHRRAFAAVERSSAPFDLWCAQTLKAYCAQPLLAWQRDGASDIEGMPTSRAKDARHAYANLVALPDADQIVREFVRRRIRFRLLRVRLQRRLWRYFGGRS